MMIGWPIAVKVSFLTLESNLLLRYQPHQYMPWTCPMRVTEFEIECSSSEYQRIMRTDHMQDISPEGWELIKRLYRLWTGGIILTFCEIVNSFDVFRGRNIIFSNLWHYIFVPGMLQKLWIIFLNNWREWICMSSFKMRSLDR